MKSESSLRKLALSTVLGSAVVIVLASLGWVYLNDPPSRAIELTQMKFWLVDERGVPTYSSVEEPPPSDWKSAVTPAGSVRLIPSPNKRSLLFATGLSGSEPRWLVAEIAGPLIPHRNRVLIALRAAGTVFAIFGLVFFTAATLTVVYLRRKSREASRIISELKAGNLKARFSIDRLDESGRMMEQFNHMADRIESLVESLRQAQTARTHLLQELAHDVRTPLTALRGWVETVAECADRLSVKEIRQKMENAERELDYFERLVADLFLLAEVGERSPQLERREVDLMELLRVEMQAAASRTSVTIRLEGARVSTLPMKGDEHLLRRLLRNGIENALEHAKSSVHIYVNESGADHILLMIRDDGPGLDPAALAAFGKRRTSRYLDLQVKRKISLGLGSLILSAIAQSYDGQATIRNYHDTHGQIAGAELTIVLARSAQSHYQTAA